MDVNELFNKAQKGNTKAEEELFSILLVRFRLIAYHIIGERDAADDVAHEATVNVLRFYRKLEVHTSFIGWAQTIVRRQALSYLEKRKKEQKAITDMNRNSNGQRDVGLSPHFDFRLMKCLRELSKVDRKYIRVLNLRHLGYTFEEICDKMNINHNNAYVLLHRARKALASCLHREG